MVKSAISNQFQRVFITQNTQGINEGIFPGSNFHGNRTGDKPIHANIVFEKWRDCHRLSTPLIAADIKRRRPYLSINISRDLSVIANRCADQRTGA